MTLHVHLGHAPEPADEALLRQRLDPEVRLSLGEEAPPRTELLVMGRPDAELLDRLKRLQLVVVPWAGVPPRTRELLAERPRLRLHNLHHNAAPTAELALALLLAAAKRVVPLDRKLRRGDWTPRYQPSQALCLDGRCALVLGWGAIGQRLGRACAALGMRVLATRRRARRVKRQDRISVHPAAALHELLPRADALLITLPLVPATEGLIGPRELELLPAGAVLVNVGRGPLVDEAALYQALRTGWLGAAGLDVWWQYPHGVEERAHTPPSSQPFGRLDNVVLSPHRGGDASDVERLRVTALARLLNAAARGRRIPNRVDVSAGY